MTFDQAGLVSDPALAGHRWRPWWLWVSAVVTVLAVAAVPVWWFGLRVDRGPLDARPVVLPETLLGLAVNDRFDFGKEAGWRAGVGEVYAGHAFDGRSFGGHKPDGRLAPPMLNLVVVRGHFPDIGDASLGREPITRYGSVQCSHHFAGADITTNYELKEWSNQNHLICVRSEPQLTVSLFALGLDHLNHPNPDALVASAVEEVFALQG